MPRHLRDGEHDNVPSSGVFGMRAGDARGAARWWALAVIVAAAVGAGVWFVLGSI